ncbi:aminotransferase class III-fold pyridoxal phosphate-dependent enzyme [Streptomyces amakusaensis]|uniref:Aspartate aminotransferase family protein n=1 Tax=Streptomyces amakusaensis TaxID=67271 RepID=A0ABW0AW53_9ACTN
MNSASTTSTTSTANTGSTGIKLAEPHLEDVLSSAGINVEYTRAERNTLYYRDQDGQEVPVLDLVGGFGSLILGHNDPEIVAHARELLAAGTPIHAQFSPHPHANRVAAELNRVIHRETGDSEPYFAVFANSGAEAVEAAVKHAELDRGLRLAALAEELAAHRESAREAVAAGATVRADAFETAGTAPEDGIEGLIEAVERSNDRRLARPPLFLAPEGAFHGKLMGSVQLTHNEAFRLPFSALAAQTRFIPVDQPDALAKTVREERAVILDLVAEDGTVSLTERPFPLFCAFVLEPIQGEGGIKVIGEEFAREVQRVCREIDCPVVVDEIQSGMGRSGAFLASSLIGLRADYYTLAKSLGGGVAKTSVALIRQGRYRKEFELVHSSTFAKDGFSSQIALKTLQLLEADDGRAYRLARERGEKLLSVLELIRADFPEVVKDVRGRGLMLGIEFHDQAETTSPEIRAVAEAGFLGYVISGHLLNEHRIRVFPTGSSVNTLRMEPSIHLDDEEIERIRQALRAVCRLIRDQDGGRLVHA